MIDSHLPIKNYLNSQIVRNYTHGEKLDQDR